MPCHCHAYRFPHREGSGQCEADQHSVFCGNCGLACDSHEEDHGVGAYEYAGARGVHRNLVTVSDCCGAEVYENARDIPKRH